MSQSLQADNVHEVIVEASFVVVEEMAKSDQGRICEGTKVGNIMCPDKKHV